MATIILLNELLIKKVQPSDSNTRVIQVLSIARCKIHSSHFTDKGVSSHQQGDAGKSTATV